MEFSWITIAASLAMGLGALFLFVFSVKRGWFKDIEDAKYQVFWAEPEPGRPSIKEGRHDGQPQAK
ncbi:MAG: cbb3-type cytochrome oxidase assembly protein [Acidobacteria bacterium]|nr:cbb3-type cytochrome oxidase assembly protein [Acidobacteriota bacterium]